MSIQVFIELLDYLCQLIQNWLIRINLYTQSLYQNILGILNDFEFLVSFFSKPLLLGFLLEKFTKCLYLIWIEFGNVAIWNHNFLIKIYFLLLLVSFSQNFYARLRLGLNYPCTYFLCTRNGNNSGNSGTCCKN